ncbi:MAG: transposase [Candidatus Nanopelagicales bacterium]
MGDSSARAVGISVARAAARAVAGAAPGRALPLVHGQVIVDIDATLVIAHSAKQWAAPTFKRGFGFHPMLAFADHGTGGTGTPLAAILRPGNAGSNTATDDITVLDAALARLDRGQRERALVRTDIRRRHYGAPASPDPRGPDVFGRFRRQLRAAIDPVPADAWIPADNGDDDPRDGAWVTEITTLLELTTWPDRHARGLQEGTSPPRRATDRDRRRRPPGHLLRDQRHLHRPAGPGHPASGPCPLRGPHPRRRGHWPGPAPVRRRRRRMRSGSRSCSWPSTSSRGPRPWPAPGAPPNPRPCAPSCSRPPPDTCAPPGRGSSTWTPTGRGHRSSSEPGSTGPGSHACHRHHR